MKKLAIIGIITAVLLGSCKSKSLCPAYSKIKTEIKGNG